MHPDKGVVGVHRKVKPTAFERLIWADGDAAGVRVHEWKDVRAGALNCFENWQPLLRHVLYAQGENLHVACWPGRKDHAVDAARFIAMEGRVFVLSVGAIIRQSDIPDTFPLKNEPGLDRGFEVMTGGAMAVGPDGKVVAGPVAEEETILYAEVSPLSVLGERDRLDPAGHYYRPDLFSVRVNNARLEAMTPAFEFETSLNRGGQCNTQET
jgi:nitrilase